MVRLSPYVCASASVFHKCNLVVKHEYTKSEFHSIRLAYVGDCVMPRNIRNFAIAVVVAVAIIIAICWWCLVLLCIFPFWSFHSFDLYISCINWCWCLFSFYLRLKFKFLHNISLWHTLPAVLACISPNKSVFFAASNDSSLFQFSSSSSVIGWNLMHFSTKPEIVQRRCIKKTRFQRMRSLPENPLSKRIWNDWVIRFVIPSAHTKELILDAHNTVMRYICEIFVHDIISQLYN